MGSSGRLTLSRDADRHDPALPALPHLLGPMGSDARRGTCALGGRIEPWRASQVQYRPGRSLTVRYATDVVLADGTRRVDTLVAPSAAARLEQARPGLVSRSVERRAGR